jgi:hypothetical protein
MAVNYTPEELEKIFAVTDVNEIEKSEDEEFGVFSDSNESQSFAQKAKDIQLIAEKESEEVMESDNQLEKDKTIISSAAKNAKAKTDDINEQKSPLNQTKTQIIGEEEEEDEPDEQEDSPKENILESDDSILIKRNQDNPLNLFGKDLENFNLLKENYGDRFTLYDNSSYMDQFFKFKVKELSFLLSKISLIDCDAIVKEIRQINVNHSIEGFPTGGTIVRKLNDVIRQRERLASIMIDLYSQYHLWEISLELLRGKLWCVKDIKGQHKREGIAMDYMADVIHYAADLKRTIDTAKHVENMLIGSWESLSRQLSCIQETQKRDRIEYLDELDESPNKLDNCSVKKQEKRIQKMPELNSINSGDEIEDIG